GFPVTREHKRLGPPRDLLRIMRTDHSVKMAVQEMAGDLASPLATGTAMGLRLSANTMEGAGNLIEKMPGLVECKLSDDLPDEVERAYGALTYSFCGIKV